MTTAVLLTVGDTDAGEVPANKAKAEAQALANEEGKVVTLRNPVTDKVLGKVKPTKAPKGGSGKAKGAVKAKGVTKAAPKAKKPTDKAAKQAARRASNEAAIKAADAAKALNGKSPKSKTTKAATPKAPKAKEPRGMVVEILKLASRPHKGVSPAELNELTKWKGAPWKWLFSNPKGTGYCDRWGYKLTVIQGTEGVRYLVTKR
jgi:hypothetical protein